ncbi:MAG TPA: ammonium transporter [Candidatus Acidoferrales bacterium]|jgi:Amt family ammonium transporter|nr:ammonium transporter [Candidatus Acidoferrales bacterium]
MIAAILNSGDTAWMLMSTALVVLMTIPGLALFYGGLVKKETVLNTLFLSFSAYAIVSIIWFIYGYPVVFGQDIHGLIGAPGDFFCRNVLESNTLVGSIPTSVYAAFQMAFAAITVALISGALIGRLKFGAWMLFVPLWATFVYLPVAHWVWGGGWLQQLGALDFAGGTVVHINSGVAALALVLLLKGRKDRAMLPHQLGYAILGAGLLWFGWFGFNAGSALTAGQLAGSAFVVTNLSAAAAMLSWMLIEYVRFGKATMLGAASGIVAGLVAITPAAGFVNIPAAILIGFVTSLVSYTAIAYIKPRLGYDDALDVFGVHGFSGMWGALATGLFASPLINAAGIGLVYGNPAQLGIQAIAVAATFAYSFIATFIIGKVVDVTIGLRISNEQELQGLDQALHEESAYHI